MMADSAIIGNDNGYIEYFRVCSLCSREIREGEQAHKLADLWVCSYCGAD